MVMVAEIKNIPSILLIGLITEIRGGNYRKFSENFSRVYFCCTTTKYMLEACGARVISVYYIIGLLVYTLASRCQCFHDNSD